MTFLFAETHNRVAHNNCSWCSFLRFVCLQVNINAVIRAIMSVRVMATRYCCSHCSLSIYTTPLPKFIAKPINLIELEHAFNPNRLFVCLHMRAINWPIPFMASQLSPFVRKQYLHILTFWLVSRWQFSTTEQSANSCVTNSTIWQFH